MRLTLSKTKILRTATAALAILLVLSGAVGEIRYGGLCSLGLQQILVTCPLGFLERSLATRELLPQWSSVVLAVLLVILLGRVFCAWGCPATLFRRVTRGDSDSLPRSPSTIERVNRGAYSSYAFLGGVLFASYYFRFPIFCFFCPIGLFFASVYATIRIFSPGTPGLELGLFPILFGIEMWGLKSWCRSICPLGALLSILGAFNPFLRPTVNKEKCLAANGINCRVCERACSEVIDLTAKRKIFPPNTCTKCLDCSDKCPVKAIRFPLLNLNRTKS